jgi:hypothetical protein
MGAKYNLADPLDVTFDISNRRETIADMFADVYTQINEDPIDGLDPDMLRPTIEEILDALITDPTDPWNEELIETLSEALEQTSGGAKVALLVSLNADGDHINVKFYDFDKEPPGWATETTSILRPYDLQASFWQSQTLTMADGRQIEYDATDLDMDYQRHAVCETSGLEFDVVEEIQPPYFVNGYLLVCLDPFGDYIDYNVAGRTYVSNAASIVSEGIVETVGEMPDPTDGSETTETSFIPLMFKAQIIQHNADGNQLQVYMWNFATSSWGIAARYVYKPYALQYGSYVGETITYLDGREIYYDTTSLDKKYQRRATWEDDEEVMWTEVQEITPSYYPGEEIDVMMDRTGKLVDLNTGGKSWAAIGEAEEPPT